VPVQVSVNSEAVDIEITGWWDRAMCLSSGVHLPLADVVEARLVTWDEARAGMGWRTGGAYWPGWIATGWYAVPDRKGARQLWAVWRDRDELLEIETRLERPTRVVLAHPDRERIAWWINERVHPQT
jgi:hypothetical protein